MREKTPRNKYLATALYFTHWVKGLRLIILIAR